MARPPSSAPAPTLEAYYMRAYRAFKSGRGPNPGPRAAYLDRAENVEADRMESGAEREWRELRGAVIENGGIRWSPGSPYGRDSMPRSVYRKSGATADRMAQVLGFDCDADLIAALNFSHNRLLRSRSGAAGGERPAGVNGLPEVNLEVSGW